MLLGMFSTSRLVKSGSRNFVFQCREVSAPRSLQGKRLSLVSVRDPLRSPWRPTVSRPGPEGHYLAF